MKKGMVILLCISILSSLWLPVNGAPALTTPTLTKPGLIDKPAIESPLPAKPTIQPELPGTGSLLPPPDPEPELLTFYAPTNLELVKAETNLVSIKWRDNSTGENKYVIERMEEDGEYSQLAVLEKDTVSYDDASVKPDTTYYYRVRARKDSLDIILTKLKMSYTAYSNELKVVTKSSLGPILNDPFKGTLPSGGIAKPPIKIDLNDIKPVLPGTSGTDESTGDETTADPNTAESPGINAPEGLEAELTDEGGIELSWRDKSNNELGFLLYRANNWEWEDEPTALDANTTRYTDEGLLSNATYQYVLYAYKDEETYAESNLVEITIPGSAPAEAAPLVLAAPENLTASAQGPTEVVLAWQDKSDNEEGFYLYKTPPEEWEMVAKLAAGTTTYTDKAAKPNTKYAYVIYSYIGETTFKESNIAEVTTPSQTAAPAAVDYTGASSWALEELQKAVGYGLYTDVVMNNYTRNITREEFCELVVKLYEKLKGSETVPAASNTFTDTTNTNILKAYAAGIVNGTGKGIFSPGNPITRQDICVMLYRAITGAVPNINTSIEGALVFEDENLIGSWAVKEVKFAAKNSIMKGDGIRVKPRDNTSREQALLLIKRTYEMFSGIL